MSNRKKVFSILILFLLVVGVPVSVFLTLQQQDIRQRASVSEGQATVSLSPTSGNFAIGQSIPITVSFNTGGVPISAIAIRLIHTSSEVTVDPASIQIVSDSGFSAANCPIKTVSTEGSQIKIDIACADISPSGISTTTVTPLATFTLVAGSVPATNPVVLTFEPVQSIITKKVDAADTLLTPTSTGTYTITQTQNPTATPTQGAPTPTPTGSATTPTPTTVAPTATRTPTPTQATTNPTQAPTATPTSPPAPTATPTTSASLPNPTPTTAITTVVLTSVRTGQTIQNPRPTFTGKAPPGSRVDIVLESDPVTASVFADENGNWSWTPPQNIPPGQHKLTVVATDPQNQKTTTVVQFTVAGTQQIPVTATSTPTVLIGTIGILFLLVGLLFAF